MANFRETKHNGYVTCIHEFADFDEVLYRAEMLDQAPTDELKRLRAESAGAAYRPFSGTPSLGAAIELARYGWPEGTAAVQELASQVEVDTSAFILNAQPEMFFDVTGSEVSLDRYLVGEPENMVNYEMTEPPKSNLLEVIINGAYPSATTREAIVGRGAALLAGIKAVQERGFSVGVTFATALASNSARRSEYYVPIQKPGEIVDDDALAFTLVHPSMLRRIMFAAYDTTEPEDVRRELEMGRFMPDHGGYGFPEDLWYPPKRDHATLVVDRRDGIEGGSEAAQKMATAMLQALVDFNPQG